MERLKRLEDKVRWCLEKFPATRSNDRYLIGSVYCHFYDIDSYQPFREIILNDRLPSFESIRRTRQKIQANDENLRGDNEKMRMQAQEDYIDYALSD